MTDWAAVEKTEQAKIDKALLEAGFERVAEQTSPLMPFRQQPEWKHPDSPNCEVRVIVLQRHERYSPKALGIRCRITTCARVRSRTLQYGKHGFNIPGIVKAALEIAAEGSRLNHAAAVRELELKSTEATRNEIAHEVGVNPRVVDVDGVHAYFTPPIPIEKLKGLLQYAKDAGIIGSE